MHAELIHWILIGQSGVADGSETRRLYEIYRIPSDLRINEVQLRRVLILGSCWFEGFFELVADMHPGCESDYVLYNNCSMLPAQPPHPADEYDFMLVQIPLRSVLPPRAYYRASYDDIGAHERLFSEGRERLLQFLNGTLRWNRGGRYGRLFERRRAGLRV
jgi:hypothetical protein